MPFCSFSSCCGNAKLSRRSRTDKRSRGGPSQSSWLELLPENDGFLECIEPLGVVAPRTGVSSKAESVGASFGEGGSGVRMTSLSVEMLSDLRPEAALELSSMVWAFLVVHFH